MKAVIFAFIAVFAVTLAGDCSFKPHGKDCSWNVEIIDRDPDAMVYKKTKIYVMASSGLRLRRILVVKCSSVRLIALMLNTETRLVL